MIGSFFVETLVFSLCNNLKDFLAVTDVIRLNSH